MCSTVNVNVKAESSKDMGLSIMLAIVPSENNIFNALSL